MLIGTGQGATLSPITVSPQDAGAASGLGTVADQLGGSLGLGILIAVAAAADSPALKGSDLLAHRIAASLTTGTAMLALAVALVVALVVRPRASAVAAHANTRT